MNFLMLDVLASVSRPLRNVKPFRFDELHYPFNEKWAALSDNLTLSYVDVGAATQPVLLMIHGLGSYLPAWAPIIQRLRRHYRCIAIDLPGYGKSTKGPYDIRLSWYARVIDDFMAYLGLDNAHVVGHSMGGQIALHLALAFPHRIQRLALLAPAGFETFNASEKKWFNASLTQLMVKMTTPRQIRENMTHNFYRFPSEAEFMIDDRIAMRGATDFHIYCGTVAKCVLAMVEEPVFDRLPQTPHSVLVVFGENDALIPNRFIHQTTPRKIAQAGAAALRNSRLLMLPECGHFVMYEQPDAAAKALRHFLEAPPAQGQAVWNAANFL